MQLMQDTGGLLHAVVKNQHHDLILLQRSGTREAENGLAAK